jgi:very-short-patch-repair endonuclease
MRIAEIAARQHGLVRTSDLRAVGLGTSAVSKRHARGLLHRVYRGVYAVGHAALSTEARWLAAVFAAGAGAALCGLAAAELWGLRRAKGAIAVVAPRQVRVDGVSVHRCNKLDPRDVTTRNGIRVTTVARTIVDLAESEKEDAFHALLRGHMAKPIANVKVLGHEVDAYWPESKLIAEIDGPGHARPRARRRDALRGRELRDAGYIVVRFTDVDVEQRPDEVLVTLLAARR